MQVLNELLNKIPSELRQDFAAACRCTWGHLRNVAYEQKPCSFELAARIERESARLASLGKIHRTVYRWDLKPDDWDWMWPELIQHPAAPAAPGSQVAQAANDPDVRRAA